MYNGIGLKTARGSGTNGYVVRNLSAIKPRPKTEYNPNEAAPATVRKPNEDVLLHKSKREIEVECLEKRIFMEESGKYGEEEINEEVDKLRAKLLARLEQRTKNTDQSVLVEEKEREMARMKDAFGIKDDFVEGNAFRFESEKKRQERLARVAEEEKQRRTRGY